MSLLKDVLNKHGYRNVDITSHHLHFEKVFVDGRVHQFAIPHVRDPRRDSTNFQSYSCFLVLYQSRSDWEGRSLIQNFRRKPANVVGYVYEVGAVMNMLMKRLVLDDYFAADVIINFHTAHPHVVAGLKRAFAISDAMLGGMSR